MLAIITLHNDKNLKTDFNTHFSILILIPISFLLPWLQIGNATIKLQLDWPDEIRDFFSIFNVLGLSLSSLSPRCVLANWTHLHKVVMINCTPPTILTVLLLYTYIKPYVRYILANAWVTTIAKLNFAQHFHDEIESRDVKVSSKSNAMVVKMNMYMKSLRMNTHFSFGYANFLTQPHICSMLSF